MQCPYSAAGYARFSPETNKTGHRIRTSYSYFHIPPETDPYASIWDIYLNEYFVFSGVLIGKQQLEF
jgi:hypothetical protein